MGKTKKELLSKAPWRGDDHDNSNKFADAKLKVTNQPGSTPKMHVPHRKSAASRLDDDDSLEIDPELRYSFQRNFQVPFSFPSVIIFDLETNPLSDNDNHDRISLDLNMDCLVQFQTADFVFLQRVFSIDTVVKPLPPAMAYNVSRNLSFFTRIFTQFFDPEGIANAQKSLGLGQEEKARRVR
ncbi:Zinc finger and BTB domain-containing protein 11 isoform 2 [Gossypium australe]|uniref:Zinc finger and BTB domain-containing protein 11 isoform 2 n=2 Tax=Gossypium TaxID=3633 RepID=A0A5B6UC21_9ROSI|nr:Zinc finger and BTB domain-containing protein 11 isoform 2 [Gossypium australe]